VSGVRYAPSPTGRFHIGNLRTAWISREIAKHLALPWIVRFEDIDRPRVVPGAQSLQLADLIALQLIPDEVLTQSQSFDRHWSLLERAIASDQAYPCDCSRKEVQTALAEAASAPHRAMAVYSGHCRNRNPKRKLAAVESIAWRFRRTAADGSQDFIVARSTPQISKQSFVPAYHWACAIDDFDGKYRVLVRASDLASALDSQRAIQSWLASLDGLPFSPPAVFHTSLVTRDDGHRLEKRTTGVTLRELLESGQTVPRLLELFEKSFERGHLKLLEETPNVVFGERKPEIKVSELL
jgi:glutamyl-tRNA synthetase